MNETRNMVEPREPELTDPVFLQNQGSGSSTIELRPPESSGPIITTKWRAIIESGDPIGDGFYEAHVVIDPASMERLRVRLNAMHEASGDDKQKGANDE
jgi:hypothetical protein